MPTHVRRSRLFYLGILGTGFVLGGFLHALLSRLLPAGAPKDVLTFAVQPTVGPFSLDLLVLAFTVGPVSITVSVMAVIGVVLAYLLARSLF